MRIHDRWSIKVDEAVYAFVGENDEVSSVEVIFKNQPLSMAGEIITDASPPKINLRYGLLLPPVLERLDHLQCVVGLILPIEIDRTQHEVCFEAETAEELGKIPITKWGQGKAKVNNKISFDIAIKGLLADPWPPNERNAAQFYRRARLAINQRFYIDSFVNYYFFLERLFASGKFKKAQVVSEFLSAPLLLKAYEELEPKRHAGAIKKGVPIGGGVREFFE